MADFLAFQPLKSRKSKQKKERILCRISLQPFWISLTENPTKTKLFQGVRSTRCLQLWRRNDDWRNLCINVGLLRGRLASWINADSSSEVSNRETSRQKWATAETWKVRHPGELLSLSNWSLLRLTSKTSKRSLKPWDFFERLENGNCQQRKFRHEVCRRQENLHLDGVRRRQEIPVQNLFSKSWGIFDRKPQRKRKGRVLSASLESDTSAIRTA